MINTLNIKTKENKMKNLNTNKMRNEIDSKKLTTNNIKVGLKIEDKTFLRVWEVVSRLPNKSWEIVELFVDDFGDVKAIRPKSFKDYSILVNK